MYDGTGHRHKQRTYVVNLPGRARISFNYNTINFKPQIRLNENWA